MINVKKGIEAPEMRYNILGLERRKISKSLLRIYPKVYYIVNVANRVRMGLVSTAPKACNSNSGSDDYCFLQRPSNACVLDL